MPKVSLAMHALLLLLLLISSPALLHAAPPDQFSFAESLAKENDHYRAITEYKRFLHFSPEDPRAPGAQLAIARSLLAGERWQKADLALEQVWLHYPNSPEALEARQLYAQSAFARKDYQLARQRYQQLKDLSPRTSEVSDYQTGLSYLEENRIAEARQYFSRLPEPTARQLTEKLDSYQQLPRKSPLLAGSLSALLPGAGQLYSERPKQAAVAFTLNAAFIYGAIEAWDNENYAVAGILTLFEIGWYGGNIYNAMNNAHKINRERETDFKRKMLNGLSLGFRKQTPWLEANFRF